MANIIGRTAECFLIHKLLIETLIHTHWFFPLVLFMNEENITEL